MSKADSKLERWREAPEDWGLKISRTKTEYTQTGGEKIQGTVKLGQEDINRVITFKYLGSILSENGNWNAEAIFRVHGGIGGHQEDQVQKL